MSLQRKFGTTETPFHQCCTVWESFFGLLVYHIRHSGRLCVLKQGMVLRDMHNYDVVSRST